MADILWRVGVQFDDDGKETPFFQVVSENTLNCLAANLDEASASKIVTALNSHQALVEALEAAQDELSAIADGMPDMVDDCTMEIITNALKLAKGE